MQPLNLRFFFRPLLLASGHQVNINKPSFSVFCCKYYQCPLSFFHACSLHILLSSWHVLCQSRLLKEHVRETSSLSPRLAGPSPRAPAIQFVPFCDPSRSWATLVWLYMYSNCTSFNMVLCNKLRLMPASTLYGSGNSECTVN